MMNILYQTDMKYATAQEEVVTGALGEEITTGALGDQGYATEVELPALPLYIRPDEEELHTSFEQAISQHMLAQQLRLSHISGPLSEQGPRTQPTAALLESPAAPARTGGLSLRQRATLLSCSALMCMLIGFDIMGLLVLHTR